MRANLRAQMHHRSSFTISLIGSLFLSVLDFFAIWVLFSNIPMLAGWSLTEVALLYAMSEISFSIAEVALGGLDRLPELVRTGTFDSLLVRPVGTIVQVATAEFALPRLGRLIQAGVVLVVVMGSLGHQWTPFDLLLLVTSITSGAVILGALWVMASGIVFVAVNGGEFVSPFTTGAAYVAAYPILAFGDYFARLITFVVPVAFVAYFPATVLLGRTDDLAIPYFVRFCAPLVALVAAIGARIAWGIGLRKYQSSGG